MSAFEQDCEFAAGLHAGEAEVDGRWDEPVELGPAFESFYREHYPFVWRSARRMLAGADEARIEDVIQDTWIAAYRRFDSYDGECRPTTWLFGILRNVARNHGRGERRRIRRVTAFADHQREREQARERDDAPLLLARTLLDDFLRTLDDDKRAVFVLAELEGQSGREIAAALDINANTAQSRLRAARKQFCAYFELPASREQIAARTRALREQPEQPSAHACARSRALLIAGLGNGTLIASGGGVGIAALGQGLLGKLAAVAGALLLVGVGVVASEREPTVEPAAAESTDSIGSPSEPVLSSVIVGVADAGPDEAVDEPAPIPVIRPVIRPAIQPAVRPAVAKPSIDPFELVRQARGALVADQPARALELLARIPPSNATLRDERAATQIAALCRLNRGSEARAVAETLAAAEPDSPLLARVESACW